MQLFSILKFISWSQFCEWLKNSAWPSRWYELEAVRNNLILVESWLTFGPHFWWDCKNCDIATRSSLVKKEQFPLLKPYAGHILLKSSATFQSISTFFGQFRRDPKHELKFRLKVIQWESTLSFNATENIFHMVDIDHDLLIR